MSEAGHQQGQEQAFIDDYIAHTDYSSRGATPDFISFPDLYRSYLSTLPSRVEMDSDRSFLDPFVEALPTTSDFQALFYSTGAKLAADFVTDPALSSEAYALPSPLHHQNPFTFQGRSLADLVPEWQKGEDVALSGLQTEEPLPAVTSTGTSTTTAVNTTISMAHKSRTQPIHAKSEHKPKNLSVAAKERRRERNKVLARKTRQKKKDETEITRDRLVALMLENEKLKHVVETHMPQVAVQDIIHTNFSMPDNIQSLVQQMLLANQRALWNEINTKQRSFCISNPQLPDCPIVFVSPGFLKLTGYRKEDCMGKNCRFLQGPETDRNEVNKMREALMQQQDITVVLLNYTKKGESFWNKIEISHLCDGNNVVRFVVGVQNKCNSDYIRTRLARHRVNSTASFDDDEAGSDTSRTSIDQQSNSNNDLLSNTDTNADNTI